VRDVKQALQFLGSSQRDVVTGLAGVVTSICFDINGCIQACLKPPLDKDGKIPDGYWIDLDRLQERGQRVMPAFPYEVPLARRAGPAEKPTK
jgi:hypothetical protein